MSTANKSATKNLFTTAKYDLAAFQQEDCNMNLFRPSFNTANIGLSSDATCDVHALSIFPRDSLSGCSKLQSPPYNFSVAAEDPCGSQFILDQTSGLYAKHIDSFPDSEKRFLVFDRSGDKMSLFYSPALKISTSMAAPGASFLYEDTAAPLGQQLHDETWDENHLTDDVNKMEEDAEEIDALLYSDSDENSDEDEVTSKEHFPIVTESGYDISESFEDFMGKAGISFGLLKRRRLLHDRYSGSSLFSHEEHTDLHALRYYEDAESNHHDYDDTDMRKMDKKVKIRRALKLLEILLPDTSASEPLSIIDKAIVYLKSMKAEVEALGLTSTTTSI